MAKKCRPQLPAVILERLPEKHGIYRELLEQIQLMTVNDRRRVYLLGKNLFRLREACTSNRNVAFWDWLETKGLDHPEVLGWSHKKIRRAIRLYERLQPVEEFLDQIQMRVQYFIADHAVNDNWLPLMRQLLMDGRTLTVDNFSTDVDPQIQMSCVSRGGTFLDVEDTEIPLKTGINIPRAGNPCNPKEGNGHCRKGELLEADLTAQNGGSNGPAESAAHESGFSRSDFPNGKLISETATMRRSAVGDHKALAKESKDALGRVIRAIDDYLGAGGIRPIARRQMAWFRKFDDGMQTVFEALEEWQNQ